MIQHQCHDGQGQRSRSPCQLLVPLPQSNCRQMDMWGLLSAHARSLLCADKNGNLNVWSNACSSNQAFLQSDIETQQPSVRYDDASGLIVGTPTINAQCLSMLINADQNPGIDPKYLSRPDQGISKTFNQLQRGEGRGLETYILLCIILGDFGFFYDDWSFILPCRLPLFNWL